MAKKNKHHPQQYRPSASASASASSPSLSSNGSQSPAVEAPLGAQQATEIERLTTAAQEVKEVNGEPLAPVPPPSGINVAQAIKSALDAERIFRAAQKKAEETRQAAEQTARALEQQRAEAEQTRKRQQEELGRQEGEVRRRKEELDARETQVLDRELRLLDGEQNAERGFLDERRRMVTALEKQLEVLRVEQEALATSADRRRSEEEEAFRRRLEERAERWRREEEERTVRWRRDDDTRAQAAAEVRGRLAEELAQMRAQARRTEEQAGAEHHARMRDAEDAAKAERAAIAAERKALRGAQSEVAAACELLEEDRRAFEKKVERVAAARADKLEEDLHAEREKIARITAERDGYFRKIEARVELDRRFGEKSPEQVIDLMAQLERKAEDLEVKLRQGLGEKAAARLAELEKERSAWLDEQAVLRAQLSDAEARLGRLRIAAVELETLRGQKEALEANKQLLGAALKDLGAEVKRYTQADEKRNPMEALLALDRSQDLQSEARTRSPLGGPVQTLADFAALLRGGIARGLPRKTLYYSERDVRCFLGGLAMSRLLLLQGISGTGKTSLPLAFAAAIQAGSEVVEVQAGWRDRQDLIGYYNAFHRHFYATNFLQALYRAGTSKYRDRPFLIVLDEINLSRVEQFFAEFLSALELPEEQRRLTLLSDPVPEPPRLMVEGRHLPIPPNVWFIGTANHDETTTGFADKTYDRAHVMELPRRDPKQSDFEAHGAPPAREPISYKALAETFADAQSKQRAAVGNVLAWLRAEDGIAPLLDKRFRIGWGNRLDRDVELFVPVVVEAGGTEGEALDHLLSTKVLRKLRDRHDVSAANLDDLEKTLESSWGGFKGAPDRSLALIERERRAKRDEEAVG
jgi:hypothetical protein